MMSDDELEQATAIAAVFLVIALAVLAVILTIYYYDWS